MPLKQLSVPIVLIAVVAIAGTFFQTEKIPFYFGAILPISGNASSSAEVQQAGLRLAQEELETLAGASLRVEIKDSALDPMKGKVAAEELIEEGATALYSSYTVVTREVSEVARQAKTPLFYDSCNCGFAKENPYAFQLYVDPRKECREAALRAKEDGGTGGAFVGQDVPYAHYCIDEISRVLGEEYVKTEFDQPEVMKSYDALFASFAQDGVAFVISLPITNNIRESIRAAAHTNLPFLCFAAQCLTPAITNTLTSEELSSVVAFDFMITEEFERAITREMPGISHDRIVAAAVAHDALIYAYSAEARCGNTSVRCIERGATQPVIPTAIVAEAFDDDRILRYTTRYVRFESGELIETSF